MHFYFICYIILLFHIFYLFNQISCIYSLFLSMCCCLCVSPWGSISALCTMIPVQGVLLLGAGFFQRPARPCSRTGLYCLQCLGLSSLLVYAPAVIIGGQAARRQAGPTVRYTDILQISYRATKTATNAPAGFPAALPKNRIKSRFSRALRVVCPVLSGASVSQNLVTPVSQNLVGCFPKAGRRFPKSW